MLVDSLFSTVPIREVDLWAQLDRGPVSWAQNFSEAGKKAGCDGLNLEGCSMINDPRDCLANFEPR
jgi:hypothetical protein